MEKINKYGLSRTIDSETKRKIRKECGFGCIVCGSSIYQYEHILPEFHEAKSHDVDKIGLLCGGCHDKVTRGILPKEYIQEKRIKPFCLNTSSSKLEYYISPKSDVVIELGKIKFINTANIIAIDGNPIFTINTPEAEYSPPMINAQFFDRNEQKIAWIEKNEWNGSIDSFDIEAIGSNLKIRSDLYKIDLELKLSHPNRISIIKLNLNYKGNKITGTNLKGFEIKTKNSSLITGTEETVFNKSLFGISIQGDKIFIGNPSIINYTTLKGKEYKLEGFYEIDGANIQLENKDDGNTSIHFKGNHAGDGKVGIKFNLPDEELPKANLNAKKQDRNAACSCGSGKKYKICCFTHEQLLSELINTTSYKRLTRDIFEQYKCASIEYRFVFQNSYVNTSLQLSEKLPIIIINSKDTFKVREISYSLLLWKNISDGFNYFINTYTNFKENIIVGLQDLLISFSIIETMKTRSIDVYGFYKKEIDYILTTMQNKKSEQKDLTYCGTSFYEAIKILRVQLFSDYLESKNRDTTINLFKEKSPIAMKLSEILNNIIQEHNIFITTGYNECLASCVSYLNELSKGEFKDIYDLIQKSGHNTRS